MGERVELKCLHLLRRGLGNWEDFEDHARTERQAVEKAVRVNNFETWTFYRGEEKEEEGSSDIAIAQLWKYLHAYLQLNTQYLPNPKAQLYLENGKSGNCGEKN